MVEFGGKLSKRLIMTAKLVEDPYTLMFLEPTVARTVFETMPEDQRDAFEKVHEDFFRSVENSWNALLGKDRHPMARLAMLLAIAQGIQNQFLQAAGYELDEDFYPIDDEDEDESEIEGDPEVFVLPDVQVEGSSDTSM